MSEARSPVQATSSAPVGIDPLAFLSGKSTHELLARFSEGDPLGFIQRAASRIRELAYLLDANRLADRTSARVACYGPSYRGDPPWETWIRAQLDEGISELLRADEEGEKLGDVHPREEDYEYIVRTFNVEPSFARTVSARFNGLPELVRKRFYVLCLTEASVEDCLAQGLGPEGELRKGVRTALRTLIDAVWGPFEWRPLNEDGNEFPRR